MRLFGVTTLAVNQKTFFQTDVIFLYSKNEDHIFMRIALDKIAGAKNLPFTKSLGCRLR